MGIINWIKDYWRDIRKSTGKTFKNVVLTAHFWVILIALGLIISMSVMIFGTLSARKDQNMAEYWQNGGKTEYRQLSVFAKGNRTDIYAPIVPLGENQSLSKKEITDIRKELQGTVDSGKTIKKKASTEVKVGDVIAISFGNKEVKAEVLDIQETVKKETAGELFKYL